MYSISILSPANISKITFIFITAYHFLSWLPCPKELINESLTHHPEAHFRTEQVRSAHDICFIWQYHNNENLDTVLQEHSSKLSNIAIVWNSFLWQECIEI